MLIALLIYITAILIIGFAAKKKGKNAKSYHGANLGVLMCVAAGAGEWMGGTSTTGVSEYGYLFGISGAWYTIANGLGIMVCAFFFAKLYRSLNTPTVPGIVGHYYGTKARTVASSLLIVVMIAVGISQMIAIGTLGKTIFNIPIEWSIAVLGIVVILYTIFGGMLAVSYTNTIHLIVMYVGMAAAVIYCVANIGDINTTIEALPEGFGSLTNIGMPKIGSWILASVLGACTAQAGIQPILAARDEKVAAKSSAIIALIVAPFGILTAVLGMIAKIQFPELSSAKLALPQLLSTMPPVLAGLVTAAMMAAVLSTASPIFLACGTLFTRDIYLRFKPETKDKKELYVSRTVTAISGAICIIAAILFFNSSTVLDIVYFAYSIRGSLFIILLFGIIAKKNKASEKAVIVSMFITAFIGFGWVIYKQFTGTYPISSSFSETYVTIITALVCMVFSQIQSVFQNRLS